MATYAEQIAQWRQQRAEQQIADRCEQITQEYAQVQRERDVAIANGDMYEAEDRDRDCQQLEQEYAQYNPPQPQEDPRLTKWAQENRGYLDTLVARVGPQRAMNYLTSVHGRVTRPRNNRDPNINRTGMGLGGKWELTPAYRKAFEDNLELYSAGDTGVPYNPDERAFRLSADHLLRRRRTSGDRLICRSNTPRP